jgi:hypothetical protein
MRTAALVVAGLMLVMLVCRNAAAVENTAASHDCPVTLPATQQTTASGSEFIYSSNSLHVWLPTRGRWPESAHTLRWYYNGAVRTRTPLSELRVTARRIDGDEAPAIIAPPRTVRDEGDAAAMVTRVELPVAGCWRISGEYRDDSLSFVVWAE